MDIKMLRSKGNLIVILIMGIVLIISGGVISKSGKKTEDTAEREPSEVIEERLERVLSTVKGAGHVSVFVVLEDYGSSDYVKDTKSRNDESEEKTVIAGSTPIVSRAQTPKIKGVIVTAQGAGNKEVKEKIKTAVETALGVMPHRVEVLEHR